MNTDEMILKILEEQLKEQKLISKRLDNIEVQLEEIRHDGKITRVATNRIGEMLEEHLLLENT